MRTCRRPLFPKSVIFGFLLVLALFGFQGEARASVTDGTIDGTYRYAWGENIGWVDFGSTTDAVHVTNSALTGSAYGENVGWIVLNPVGYGGVLNDGEGHLSGYAWGENTGWIDFSQVVIDANGYFTGQAYGENIGWITFSTTTENKVITDWRVSIRLSGTLYSDEGSTLITAPKTIAVAVGTSTVSLYATTTSPSGTWSIDIPNSSNFVGTSTPIIIWTDATSTVRAALFTKASSTLSIANLNLYKDRVIISHEGTSGTSTTFTDMAFYDGDNDADIQYQVNAATTTLTVSTGNELHIQTGKTFASGGTVYVNGNASASSTDGSFHLPASSTYTAGGNMYLAGNLGASSSAIVTTGIYALNFTATTTGKTLSVPTTTIGNTIFSGDNGSWAFTTNATATSMTIEDGSTLIAPADTLTVQGPLRNYGTYTHNNGTTTLDTTTAQVISYLAGRDASGDSTGNDSAAIFSMTTIGSTLYVGKQSDDGATACSQVAGSAIGCELMVFDISSTTNPRYIAGRDASGNSTGTGSGYIYTMTTVGSTLYVGKSPDSTACSQVAGSAQGCELMVFDISSTTNPQYTAGRDASGNSTGTGYISILSMTTLGSTLYVGKGADSTACSQVAGSAIGCDLMVFDISSTTNPRYTAGRDVKGDSTGTGFGSINSLTTLGSTLYVGKGGDAIACSQTPGSADGCELMVFDISSTTNPRYTAGRDFSGDSTGTGDLSILSMTTIGSALYVGKDEDGTACSQVAGSAHGCEFMVFDISSTTNPIYVAGRDATGDSTGTGFGYIYTMTTLGSTLYVGKQGDSTACSQVAGSASGCELMVFDISSTTNPRYTAGRDVKGDSTGTGSGDIRSMTIIGSTLYVGKGADAHACSQTAGSADGCELMVFSTDLLGALIGSFTSEDALRTLTLKGENSIFALASTTNTRVISGTTTITQSLSASSTYTNNGTMINEGTLAIGGTYTNNGVYDTEFGTTLVNGTTAQTLSGTMTGTSAFSTLRIEGSGTKTFTNNASTTDLTISAGATLVAPPALTIAGNYENSGTYTHNSGMTDVKSYITNYLAGRDASGDSTGTGSAVIYTMTTVGSTLYVGKSEDATACSQVAGSADGCELMVFDISSTTNPRYTAGRDASGDSTGTGSATILSMTTIGSTLYVGKGANPTACSQTPGSADGCELMVFDISSTTNPGYTAGRDVKGDSTGTGLGDIYTMTTIGSTLYVGKGANPTACSQTPGSADGCELMVFDISSTTNPRYTAGRDVKGDSTGTGWGYIYTMTTIGSTLYVGKYDDSGGTACSQVAGSAQGCELMVFDISSTTNPQYTAGRDATGDSTGTGYGSINTMTTIGSTLYVGKSEDATACSQTAGSAEGCELMVFDISSTTNPQYTAGRESSGDSTGTGSRSISTMTTIGSTLYVGKYYDFGINTACSQTLGSAQGCELMVFDISSTTNPQYTAGRDASGNSTGTGWGSISTMTTTGSTLYVGKYANPTACSQVAGSAIGCELMVMGLHTMSGSLTGASSFNNLTISGAGTRFLSPASTTATFTIQPGANVEFLGNATSTFENINWGGSSTSPIYLRSNASGTPWNLIVPGEQQLVSYVHPQDSHACSEYSAISATDGTSVDEGGNTCWAFVGPYMSSADNQVFAYGQATTTMSPLTIGGDAITASGDIRIRIATSSAHMLWNTNDTSAVITGTASGKVSDTVSYENGGATLVVNVTSGFTEGETITISGLSYSQFSEVHTPVYALKLYTEGASDTTVDATDNKTLAIYGLLTLGTHEAGQIEDNLESTTEINVPLYRFSLTSAGEESTISELTIRIMGSVGVIQSDITNLTLYRDNDEDGTYSSGDTQIGGTPAFNLTQSGTITFTTPILATSTTAQYVLMGSATELRPGDSIVLVLDVRDIVASGNTTGSILETGDSGRVQHMKGSGGGGGHSEIGGAVPLGEIRTGGSNDGGEILGGDVGFFPPTAQTGSWTAGANAYISDGVYATTDGSVTHTYTTYSFAVPGSNAVSGVEVRLEASASTNAGTVDVRLSWDNGNTWTSTKTTDTLTTTDAIYELGSQGDTWGHTWTPGETGNSTFLVELTGNPSSNTVNLDALQVRVYHQATGGGQGGGSEALLYIPSNYASVREAGFSLGVSIERFIEWLASWWKN